MDSVAPDLQNLENLQKRLIREELGKGDSVQRDKIQISALIAMKYDKKKG